MVILDAWRSQSWRVDGGTGYIFVLAVIPIGEMRPRERTDHADAQARVARYAAGGWHNGREDCIPGGPKKWYGLGCPFPVPFLWASVRPPRKPCYVPGSFSGRRLGKGDNRPGRGRMEPFGIQRTRARRCSESGGGG